MVEITTPVTKTNQCWNLVESWFGEWITLFFAFIIKVNPPAKFGDTTDVSPWCCNTAISSVINISLLWHADSLNTHADFTRIHFLLKKSRIKNFKRIRKILICLVINNKTIPIIPYSVLIFSLCLMYNYYMRLVINR